MRWWNALFASSSSSSGYHHVIDEDLPSVGPAPPMDQSCGLESEDVEFDLEALERFTEALFGSVWKRQLMKWLCLPLSTDQISRMYQAQECRITDHDVIITSSLNLYAETRIPLPSILSIHVMEHALGISLLDIHLSPPMLLSQTVTSYRLVGPKDPLYVRDRIFRKRDQLRRLSLPMPMPMALAMPLPPSADQLDQVDQVDHDKQPPASRPSVVHPVMISPSSAFAIPSAPPAEQELVPSFHIRVCQVDP